MTAPDWRATYAARFNARAIERPVRRAPVPPRAVDPATLGEAWEQFVAEMMTAYSTGPHRP